MFVTNTCELYSLTATTQNLTYVTNAYEAIKKVKTQYK